MFDKEKEHSFFGECWKMFNEIRKDNSDEGWEKCLATARSISGKERLHEKIILAVMDEAEVEASLDIKERTLSYKKAGAAFQDAWKMFSYFLDKKASFPEICMKTLQEYHKTYDSKFASDLATAIYEAMCKEVNVCGAFMSDAFHFYVQYKDGITETQEAAASAEAENIINVYPEHTLQMMDMYAGLQKRGRTA